MRSAYTSLPPYFSKAVDQEFPAFLDGVVASSSPGRGTPYLAQFSEFEDRIRALGSRDQLLAALKSALDDLRTACRIHGVLIGGSVLRSSIKVPRDCDAIVFYSLLDDIRPEKAVESLLKISSEVKEIGVDVRLIPVDTNPIDLIKAACYFSVLFAAERGGVLPKFGTALVELD